MFMWTVGRCERFLSLAFTARLYTALAVRYVATSANIPIGLFEGLHCMNLISFQQYIHIWLAQSSSRHNHCDLVDLHSSMEVGNANPPSCVGKAISFADEISTSYVNEISSCSQLCSTAPPEM